MKDFSSYKEIGKTTNTIVYMAESDPDIMIVVPREGTMDTARDAQENAAFFMTTLVPLENPVEARPYVSLSCRSPSPSLKALKRVSPVLNRSQERNAMDG